MKWSVPLEACPNLPYDTQKETGMDGVLHILMVPMLLSSEIQARHTATKNLRKHGKKSGAKTL